jgi:hypothetical protein
LRGGGIRRVIGAWHRAAVPGIDVTRPAEYPLPRSATVSLGAPGRCQAPKPVFTALPFTAMPDFLFYGDTERSPALRHELPVTIGDGFLLGVVEGRTHIMVNRLERARVEAAAPDAILHDIEALGFLDMLQAGTPFHEIDLELTSRAAAAMGVREAVADPEMPVAMADRLRADGIVLHPDHVAVTARRRRKTAAELAGIRRAQSAAEAGMAAAAALLREARTDGDRLRRDGEVLTADAGAIGAARRLPPCGRHRPR